MSLDFGACIPFVDHLGFTLELFEGGRSELHYAPKPEHQNSFAVTHGGACMTFLDVVMATASRSVAPEMGVVTIEMKTSFMRPARVSPPGKLVGRGRLLHRTRHMAFAEGTLYDDAGQACAHATGTFKYVARQGRAGTPGEETSSASPPGPIATD